MFGCRLLVIVLGGRGLPIFPDVVGSGLGNQVLGGMVCVMKGVMQRCPVPAARTRDDEQDDHQSLFQ